MKRALVLLLLAGCGTNNNAADMAAPDGGSDGGGCAPVDGGATTTVTVVSGQQLGVIVTDGGVPDGGPATTFMTAVDVPATVPEGCWSSIQVQMHVKTNCKGVPPQGQNWPPPCDPYDRLAQVWLNDKGATPLFVLDAVTPFGGETTWTQDVTDYYALLVGTHTYHVEVGTYADPSGQATGTMAEHQVDVSILLVPGAPPRQVLAAVPLFRQGIDDNTMPLTAKLNAPDGATHARLDYFESGHGGNGNPPCDEFCQKENDITIDGMNVYADSPQSDCSDNCTHVPIGGTISCGGQTFNYICKQNPTSCPSSAIAPRSNWCPSQIIPLIQVPLPSTALTGSHDVGLQIQGVNGSWSIGLSAVYWK